MEELKPLAELAEPDIRYRFFVVREAGSAATRPLSAADIHEMAALASLHDGVPEEVRTHFSMAQNLLAYSWYCYPFHVAAELHAYVSVEFALKVRYPEQSRQGMHKLLERAVTDGLLRAEGFTFGRDPDRQLYPPEMELPHNIPSVRDYVADVSKAMRTLRNSLAHGAPTLHSKGGTILLVCSELINQLFPQKA